MPNTFFTADLHFDHENIIKFCNRPFKNAQEMNESLISNWNGVVKPEDTVFVLGDVGFCDAQKLMSYIRRLNGEIHLIYGNHDKVILKHLPLKSMFKSVYSFYETRINGIDVTLCHYPMVSWNKSFHGSFQLHGHEHGNIPDDKVSRRMDVGVDVWDFTPVEFSELERVLSKRPIPREVHGKRSNQYAS